MGMYVGGEIADLARIARPRIGVVTAVQPVHLSRIGSLEAIEAAKGELLEALPPDGTADPQRRRPDRPPDGRTARRRGASPTGSPTTPTSAPRPSTSAGLDGMRFVLRAEGARRPVTHPDARPAVGPQRAGRGRGRPRRRPVARRDRGRPRRPAGRRRTGSQLVRLGGVTLVDDTYNASPRSVVAALDLLAGLPGRRVAVLGEMLELGEAADEGHRAVGEAAARTVDWLVVVGDGRGGHRRGRPRRRAGPGPDRPRPRRRGRPRGVLRRGCATATSCSSRRRAGSGSTGSSTASGRELGGRPVR